MRPLLSRLRPWLMGLAAAGALAVTILAVAAVTAPRDAKPDLRTSALTAAQRADSLAKQAEQAERSGDTSQAAALARQAVAAEPQNVAARTLLERLESGTSDPAPSSPGDTPSAPGGKKPPAPAPSDPDAGFDREVADISKLLPYRIDGYVPGMTQADDRDAVVPFDPQRESRTVRTVLFSVHDQGSADKAREFIDSVLKVAFPGGSPHEVVVPGVSRPAYFGTQGRVATVGFVRGRYAFEVSVTGVGVDPSALRAVAIEMAAKFPTEAP